jgi:hypothetical protein
MKKLFFYLLLLTAAVWAYIWFTPGPERLN